MLQQDAPCTIVWVGARAAVLHPVQVVPDHVVAVALAAEAVAPVVVLADALADALGVALAVVPVAAVHVLVTVAVRVPEDVLVDARVAAHLDVQDVPEGARVPASTVANGAPLN